MEAQDMAPNGGGGGAHAASGVWPLTLAFRASAHEHQFALEWHCKRRLHDLLWALFVLGCNLVQLVQVEGQIGAAMLMKIKWRLICMMAPRLLLLLLPLLTHGEHYAKLRPWALRLHRLSRVAANLLAVRDRGAVHVPLQDSLTCRAAARILMASMSANFVASLNFPMMWRDHLLFALLSTASTATAAVFAGGCCPTLSTASLVTGANASSAMLCEQVLRMLRRVAVATDTMLGVLSAEVLLEKPAERWATAAPERVCVPVILLAELLLGLLVPALVLVQLEWRARLAYAHHHGIDVSLPDPDVPPVGPLLDNIWVGPLCVLCVGWPLLRNLPLHTPLP